MDNKSFARIAVWILVAVVLFTVFRQFETNSAQPLDQTSYTQFMDDAKAGKIRKVEVQGRKILVTPQSGAEYAIFGWSTTCVRTAFRCTARLRKNRPS